MPIRTVADIEAFEAQPLAERALPQSTYEALAATASRTPRASALSFFLTADTYKRAFTWTYRELLADITRAAKLSCFRCRCGTSGCFRVAEPARNAFYDLGRRSGRRRVRDQPLAGASPHCGTVARCARARTGHLAPAPAIDLWAKLAPYLRTLNDLRVVAPG